MVCKHFMLDEKEGTQLCYVQLCYLHFTSAL